MIYCIIISKFVKMLTLLLTTSLKWKPVNILISFSFDQLYDDLFELMVLKEKSLAVGYILLYLCLSNRSEMKGIVLGFILFLIYIYFNPRTSYSRK